MAKKKAAWRKLPYTPLPDVTIPPLELEVPKPGVLVVSDSEPGPMPEDARPPVSPIPTMPVTLPATLYCPSSPKAAAISEPNVEDDLVSVISLLSVPSSPETNPPRLNLARGSSESLAASTALTGYSASLTLLVYLD